MEGVADDGLNGPRQPAGTPRAHVASLDRDLRVPVAKASDRVGAAQEPDAASQRCEPGFVMMSMRPRPGREYAAEYGSWLILICSIADGDKLASRVLRRHRLIELYWRQAGAA